MFGKACLMCNGITIAWVLSAIVFGIKNNLPLLIFLQPLKL